MGQLSFMRERDSGENRQQWHYLPTQTALISPHPVIKVDGDKEQLKTSRGVTVTRSHLVQSLIKTPQSCDGTNPEINQSNNLHLNERELRVDRGTCGISSH